MALTDSVPPALALTVGNAGSRLSMLGTQPGGDRGWAWLEALELDLPKRAAHHDAGNAGIDRLKTRRLALREASLCTDLPRLQTGLRACVSNGSGFSDLRVWFGAGVPWIGGRVTIGHRAAPFTIRLAWEPRATGQRRLALFLGDVRLYAPLPLPAPLVGSALARAIVAGCGGASSLLTTRDGGVELAPLELALIPTLVAAGWRMPDLRPAMLRAIVSAEAPDGARGVLRLLFGGAPPVETASAAPAGCRSWLEGERLPDALAGGERALFAGDVRAAEKAYRAHLAVRPEELAAQARLVALAAPAGTAVLDAGARALAQAWPEFLPGWLYAALGAWQAGERDAAATCFLRASALAAARGEHEDARLAAEAAATVREEASGGAAAGALPPGEPAPTPGGFAAAVAHALLSGDRASAEAAIDAHLRSHDDPSRRGELHTEIAEALLAAGGGNALALATLAEVSLAGSSDHGLELRATLAEREGNAPEAARTLGELISRALAAGQPARARALAERQARLAAASGAKTAMSRPGEPNDSDDATVPGEAEREGAQPSSLDLAQDLTARADLAFRVHDWPLARALYDELAQAPHAGEALPRETLVHRRAVLARDAGDHDVAEACFRELAILEPGQLEARQALAELAVQRGDRAAAVQRLEEVLHLLPLDALDTTLAVREQLGQLHAELEDWGAARYYQELILAQDGGRVTALERLIVALSHLELFEEAAAACERLSRFHPEPARRAQALHQQGELLLERLHDEPRAFEAFLKASDLAPAFLPTASRLVSGFWTRGRFADVAEVASELARTGALARATLLVRVRAGLAAAIAGHEPAPITPAGIDDAREQPRVVASALAEAAQHLGAATPASLEPAVKLIVGPGGSEARAALASLTGALTALLADDPAAAGGGAALALGWLAERREDATVARPLYALAAFLNGGAGVATRFRELGPCAPATAASMALAGGNDHPGVGGTAAPLRRALGALAHGLAGFGPLATRPATTSELPLPPERREAWQTLASTMATPLLEVAVAEPPDGTAEDATEDAPDVSAMATHPGLITIPRPLLMLPDDELTFLVARAFDRLRGGLALIDAATSGEAAAVEALLRGAAAALAGRTPPELPLAIAAAAELSSPDRAAALLGTAPRPRVAGDLLLAEEALVGWEGFRAASLLASDRFALLACRSPLASLQAMYRRHAGDESGSDQARRAAFLRSPRVRQLVSFLTSPAYADATRDAALE